jgi:hypothetical protein
VDGVSLLFYGMFVGVPLLVALLGTLFGGVQGLRVLRSGQCPYPGAKVLQRRRILRGWRARLIGWLQLLAPLGLVGVAIWGAGAAGEMIGMYASPPPPCVGSVSERKATAQAAMFSLQ